MLQDQLSLIKYNLMSKCFCASSQHIRPSRAKQQVGLQRWNDSRRDENMTEPTNPFVIHFSVVYPQVKSQGSKVSRIQSGTSN